MKSKQVAALMMAATLAVTGSGVTTMAGQMNAGDEAVVWETESSFKKASAIEKGETLIKLSGIDEEINYCYGSEVSVTAELEKVGTISNDFNPTLQLVEVEGDATLDDVSKVKAAIETAVGDRTYQAAWDKDGKVIHTFKWKPQAGKKYYILATVVKAGDNITVKQYKVKEVSLTLDKENKTQAEIKKLAPVIPEIVLPANAKEELTQIGKNPVIKEAIETANAKLTNGEGTWGYNDANEVESLEKGTTEIKLKFTSSRYEDKENGVGGVYDNIGVPVKVTQKTATVTLNKGASFDQPVADKETLKVGGGTAESLEVKAEFDEAASAEATTPKAVTWKYLGDAAEYVTITDQKNGKATINAKKATGKDGVVVRAEAADNPEVAYKDIQIVVNQGISKADVTTVFKKYLPELKNFTYAGNESFADHFEKLLDQMNGEGLAAYGTFSLVEGEDLTTAGNAAEVAAGEHKLALVYTVLEKDLGNVVDSNDWTADSQNKKLTSDPVTVKVSPKEISQANVLGEFEIQSEGLVIGATLDNIFDATTAATSNKTYTIEWQKLDAGKWKKATSSTEKIETIGKLTGYRLSIGLQDSQQNYKLTGADADGKIYVTPDVTIGAPAFEVTVPALKSKITEGGELTLTAKPDKNELVTALGAAATYYDTDNIFYQWYQVKDGKVSEVKDFTAGDKDTFDGAKKAELKIGKITKASEAEYYCTVSVDLNETGKGVEALAKSEYSTLKRESNKLKVQVSNIVISEVTGPSDITYGTKSTPNKGTLEATLEGEGITAYSISYCALDKDGKEQGARTEVTPDNYLFDGNPADDVSGLFAKAGGYKITHDVSAMMLPAGDYNFYVTAKAGEKDENTYGPVKVTVKQAELTKLLSADKLSAETLTYGAQLSDAVFTYEGEDGAHLKFTAEPAEDQKAPKAGKHKVTVKVEPENENYKLGSGATTSMQAEVTVQKAKLTVEVSDTAMTVGDKKAEIPVKVSGLVYNEKEADIVTVKAVVFDKNKKEVSDLSTLAAGAYQIDVVAELTDAGKENYEVTKTTGILEVKAAEQKPSTETEQKPGTEQKPSTGTEQKPSTGTEQTPSTGTEQKPATGTEQTPSTGTEQKPATGTEQTPATGTEQKPAADAEQKPAKVTAKKVDITLNGQSLSGTVKAKVKATYKLKAQVTLSNNKKNSKVTWTSSNKKIATVNKNGVVKVLNKTGKVKITAKSSYGKSKTITLQVTKSNVKATKIAITGSKTMKVKKSQTLKATVSPATVTNAKVTWKSSNSKIATVNANGKVTAKKKGTVKITATAKDGSKKKAVFTIKVK